MLAKLTEIYPTPMQTGSEFGLREVYVNPKSVSMIRPEPAFRRYMTEGKLPKGIDERMEFSRISVESTHFVVVGNPQVIEKKLNESRHLLKG